MFEDETLETQAEISEENLNAFDEEWNDAPSIPEESENAGEELGDTKPETEAEQLESQEADGAEEESAGAPEQPEDGAETQQFTVKHMKEEKQLGLEEMLSFAQKGMDYDGLRADRDRLREDNAKLKAYEAFLEDMAKREGFQDASEQITSIRARWLQEDERAKGSVISDSEAIFRVQRQREALAVEKTEPDGSAGDPAQDKQHGMFQAFVEEFPDVKAESIPDEVWQEVAKTGDLSGAYRRYENGRLKAELETLRQNEKNRERSTGSRKTAGAAIPKDPFDEAWDSF